MGQTFAKLTAAEAAGLIKHGEVVGFSGFTPAGAAKAVPKAIAQHALREHAAGRPFRIGVMTGASTGPSLDGSLAKANAVLFRTPYQSDPDMRKSINSGKTHFYDMHLSMIPQNVRYGFLGPIHRAVIEACDVNDQGEITLTSSVGASPTYCAKAERILVELNRYHIKDLHGMHDVYEPANPPHRRELPLYKPSDRIGSPVVKVNPKKIVGIVENDQPDETGPFSEPDAVTKRIGEYVADFLASELKGGRIPKDFLPIQSGVGDTANAVLAGM
jgi:acyl-CoA hydrolase